MTRNKARILSRKRPEVIAETLYNQGVTIDSLTQKVKRLEIQIAKRSKHSSNSHKPPSSDDITKPKSKTKKKKKEGKRSIGGQPGHPKHERPPFPDEEIHTFYDYTVTRCPRCNGQVEPMDHQEPKGIQQGEILEIPLVKEEHISYPMWCEECQKIHYGSFPPEVVKAGLFKERITALVAYMKHGGHASFSTIRKFIRDILSLQVSRGYLRKMIQKVGPSLEAP